MDEPSPSSPRVSESHFTPLGRHEYAISGGEGRDGGDILHLHAHGRIELRDVELILSLLDRIAAQHGLVKNVGEAMTHIAKLRARQLAGGAPNS